jgi:coenzyme F420-reducing hydrogenase alpha subunit
LRPFVEIPLHAAVGYGCTEAPRGILYHRYRVNAEGLIEEAKIVPPTSQNQKSIEEDLFELAPRLADLPHADATRLAEHAVRNYDPCISCSTHFLKLQLEHETP